MGGICSRRSTEDSALVGGFPHANGRISYGAGVVYLSGGLPAQGNDNLAPSRVSESTDKKLREPFTFPDLNPNSYGIDADIMNDGIPGLYSILSHKSRSTMSKQVAVAKVSEVSSILGRAGTAGLGKAVEVLDTLGSSMTSLNIGSGFVSGAAIKGNKISILCFEVANTVVKGANLMRALSMENIKHLKEVVLPSEGVQRLISKDTEELLRIAEADKRDELRIFSSEVVRFGNRCKDPQWHNLDRYFEKLEPDLAPQKQLKEEADSVMRQMMTLVQETADLYHELHALDRFEQDYKRKLQEEDNSSTSQRGDSLAILKAELKSQKKHVRGLKKKSLWCRSLEEMMEKLVEIVHFLHKQINDTFGGDRDGTAKCNHQKLGSAGLALHYANIITQIDTLVTRSSALPPSTRDSLYHGLPPSIKFTLRSKLHSCNLKEELTVPQIKAEMEKTLQWLVPIATNTSKAHHGFGWVGEWANTGSEMNDKPALIRIETLHHANKEKTELYILELVVWLHHLVVQTRACNGGIKSPVISSIRSPNQKTIPLSYKPSSPIPTLTVEDQEMLRDVSQRRLTPGLSKSQEFDIAKTRFSKDHRLSKSSSHSPTHEFQTDPFPIKRLSSVPIIDFDFNKVKALDVIDRVDDIQSVLTV